MSNAIIFIESSTSGAGYAALRQAARRGYLPVLLAKEPRRYHFSGDQHFLCEEVDTNEVEACIETIERLRMIYGVAGIGTTADDRILHAARCASHFGVVTIAPDIISLCKDKSRVRVALSNTPFNIEYRTARDVDASVAAARAIGCPVIVKPSNLTGGAYVKLTMTETEVAAAAKVIVDNTSGEAYGAPIIIEKYVDGLEYTAELFDRRVLALCRREPRAEDNFTITSVEFPAKLPGVLEKRCKEAIQSCAEILCLDTGPYHFQFKLVEDMPRIIEINPRLPGGMIAKLIEYGSGIAYIDGYISYLTGQPPRLEGGSERPIALKYFVLPQTARFAGATGIEDARRIEGVLEIAITAVPGQVYRKFVSNGDRMGHVIATGEDAEDASRRADMAMSLVALDWVTA